MTEALASRVAGLKLGGIVGVLLLPMLLLSYLMINSLREEIRIARHEMHGAALNRLVLPVAVGAAMRYIDEGDIERLRKEGPAIAAELGLQRQLSAVLADLITYGFDQRLSLDSLRRLQIASASSSLIIHDQHTESYHLGAIMNQHAPSQLHDYSKLSFFKTSSLRDGQISREENAAILLATGAWQELQRRLAASLAAAQAASAAEAEYSSVADVVKQMEKRPRRVAAVLAKSNPQDLDEALASAGEFGIRSSEVIAELSQVWSFSSARFETLLRHRLNAMQIRFYALLTIAAAACLVGVGGAALMFRSTLRRLDIVGEAKDIAEKARIEAELAASEVSRINEDMVKLNADLARNIDMLRDAQDEALRKGKMAQLGQLTATVAHELRNPLGAVRTSAFLLERKVKGKGLGIEPQLERINNGVTRCDNIISQLLDFARSKALQPEQISFDDWLAKIIEEEAQKLPEAVAIECRLGLGGTISVFDPARMGRVIINLVTNASEALVGKGDDPSKFTSKAPTITVSTAATARGIELVIADNGPGIPPELVDKVFEPLFTTKNFGTGLGLPAVQKILEQHGGNLEIRSHPGQGAEFIAWWPVSAELKEAV